MEHDGINPDWQNSISRRIVEVTDEDETLFLEFIEAEYVSPYPQRPT